MTAISSDDLKERLKRFALRAMRLVDALPRTPTADVLGRQIVRSATSVGANYRSACRARSRADFVSKLGIVEEEADECVYWLELIVDAELIRRERAADLMQEACEITAIVVSSIKRPGVMFSDSRAEPSHRPPRSNTLASS